jgi:NADH-quinone oxidoreductase subunit N
LVALMRLLTVIPPQFDLPGWKVFLAISACSMTLGNVLALWQQNPRRLMAYSSIAHAGYMLIGIAVALAASGRAQAAPSDGIAAALVYLVVYSLATVGMFAALTYLGRKDGDVDSVDDLAGLGSTHRLLAVAICVFMFSLTGIPPMAGFWGKLVLFTGALAVDTDVAGHGLRNWFVGLAAVGAVNAAISAGYYLRIVGVMYFRAPLSAPRAEGGSGAWLAAVASAILLVLVGLFPRGLMDGAGNASRSVRAAISRSP